ncbi:MAG: hypothetical protein K2Y25_03065 [Pseudomonadaceae bacterium]|jgi:hypothetical protein|nr:hypothetical protein [Pseudomonadaceae bacterium]
MPRVAWSLHAYQMIEPDEQLDLFACREVRVHLLARQLELGGFADRTLCAGLLPAHPQLFDLSKVSLRDQRLCPHCLGVLQAQRRGERPLWPTI